STTSSSTTTSTSGTTTGSCNPALNSSTFTTSMFTSFSSMSSTPTTWNGYYTLFASITVNGNLRTIRLSLPMASAPTTSATYALDYNYFTNGYVLSSGKCGLRFYEATSGNTNIGYGSSGTVTVTVTGTYVVAKFCSITFKAYSGSTFMANYLATGKLDN
ncbi:MAG: hypothetical protein IAF38_09275, partial [Bacteroidia bacterium]|nr:hypothetical protein [Bacteroidia bacterium]